jgi:transcription antitermination factor NusG
LTVRYLDTRASSTAAVDLSNSFITSGWFAVFTHPRHEKKVVGHLEGRGIEAFLPTYKTKHVWKNRQTKTLDLPLFPTYLFAKVETAQRGTVLGVPGVVSIVGNRHSPAWIPDHYIQTLRLGVASERILPHPDSAVGDHVRVVSGCFAGEEGTLTEVRNRYKVVVRLELIHSCFSFEAELNEIELVSSRGSRACCGREEAQGR